MISNSFIPNGSLFHISGMIKDNWNLPEVTEEENEQQLPI